MEEYFSRKNVTDCQIYYFKISCHKVNEVRNQKNSMRKEQRNKMVLQNTLILPFDIWTAKGRCFFLKILCHIFQREKSQISLQFLKIPNLEV